LAFRNEVAAMIFRTKRRTAQGAALIEFALIGLVFFVLMFIIIDLGLLYWVNLTMQHAVREGARYAVTGQSNLDTSGRRYMAVIQEIQNQSMGLYAMVKPTIVVNGVAYGTPEQYTPGMFGNSGDMIVLQLNCTWPLLTPVFAPLFPGGQYRFSVAATMRNEAFQ
jgi:Flp pilus assembly protein TadG